MNTLVAAAVSFWLVASGPGPDMTLAQSMASTASRAEQTELTKSSPDVFDGVLTSVRGVITASGDSPASVVASLEYVLGTCKPGGGSTSGLQCPRTDAAYEALTNLLALARELAGQKPATGLGGDGGSAPFGPPGADTTSGPNYHGSI